MVRKPPKKGNDDLEFLDDSSLDEEFIEVEEDTLSNEDKTVPRAKMPQQVRPIEPLKEIPPPPPIPPQVPEKPIAREPVFAEAPVKTNPRDMVISSSTSDTLISTISENLTGYKLIFFDGPNMGDEYSLDKNIITLGRGADNDIVIKDVSVSRRHAEISHDLGQVIIRDLGSGNGVVLNDEKVSEKQLFSGDVIKLGNTKIRFVSVYDIYTTDQEQAWIGEKVIKQKVIEAASENTSPTAKIMPARPVVAAKETVKKRPLLLYAGILFVLFMVLLVFVKLVILAPQESDQIVEKGEQGAKDEKAVEALRLLDEGIKSYKMGDFKGAQEKFISALSLDPKNRRAQQYKSRSEEELINKNYLDSAKEFMNKDSPKGAIEVAKKISTESVFYNDAQTIIKTASTRYISQLMETAQKQIDEKDYQNALESVQEILTLDPSDTKAQEMKAQIEKNLSVTQKKGKGAVKKVEMASKVKKEAPAVKEEESPSKTISAPGPVASKAVQLFKEGDVNAAVQTIESSDAANNPKVQKLLQNLKAFAEVFPSATSAYKAKKDTAISALERSLSIARSIAPKGNKYLGDISKMLSDMYTYKGIKDFYKEDYFSAIDNLQKALKLNPANETAKKKMVEMGNVAQRLFEEAYVLKNADPEAAKKKFKIILKIAPPDSEFYKKAKEWITKL